MNQETTQFRNQSHQSGGRNMSRSEIRPTQDLMQYMRDYARERPDAAALWCFGIGFVLGWKLKPW